MCYHWTITTDKAYPTAGGASEASNTAKKGSEAEVAGQDAMDDGPAYDGECWAFSSRYVKTTQAALQAALDAIQVAPAVVPSPCSLYIFDCCTCAHLCDDLLAAQHSPCLSVLVSVVLLRPGGSTLLLSLNMHTAQHKF